MSINTLKFLDKYIFRAIAVILGVFTRRKIEDISAKNAKKDILVIKLWAIGDAVNSLPMIKSIKDHNPGCRISVLTKESLTPVYKQEFIDDIILASPKNMLRMILHPRRFDVTLDLEPFLNISAIISWYLGKYRIGFSNQSRSRIYNYPVEFSKKDHIVDTYMNMASVLNVPRNAHASRLIGLKYTLKDSSDIKAILEKNANYRHGKTMLFGICAGVGDSIIERAWPKERFKQLSNKILRKHKDCMIILIGSRFEYELSEYIRDDNDRIINTCGALSLGQLFAVVAQMDVFISNDTGPMHIAAAQGVKTIGLFGPNTPKIWAPYGKGNISISHKVAGCPYMDNTKHELAPRKLTDSQRRCMESITVQEVLRHV